MTKITKSQVMNVLGISKLDKEIAENTLELCGINPTPENTLKYDGVSSFILWHITDSEYTDGM